MKMQLGTSVDKRLVLLLDYLADDEGVSRSEMVRRAILSFVNSRANDIELEKEIERVKELGEEWNKASRILYEKCEAERKLIELAHERHEAQVWKSLKSS